ncbi:hypothetical protein J6590_010259 [Homalodisca vitripennis]|nr:hypothetical protein J6590_010259 [Homalodisca vitripennis]
MYQTSAGEKKLRQEMCVFDQLLLPPRCDRPIRPILEHSALGRIRLCYFNTRIPRCGYCPRVCLAPSSPPPSPPCCSIENLCPIEKLENPSAGLDHPILQAHASDFSGLPKQIMFQHNARLETYVREIPALDKPLNQKAVVANPSRHKQAFNHSPGLVCVDTARHFKSTPTQAVNQLAASGSDWLATKPPSSPLSNPSKGWHQPAQNSIKTVFQEP